MGPAQYDIGSSHCLAAFRSVRAGKNVFMFILAGMILLQLAGFVLVNFVGVIDEVEAAPIGPGLHATTQEVRQQAEARAQAAGRATQWQVMLRWVFPATRFLAFVMGVLAVLTLMFAVKLSLLGRLGGIPGFMSAFLWSLILLATVTPWQQLLNGALACGALYNLKELVTSAERVKASWGAADADLLDWIFYYARFIAYPVIALLIWLVVMTKFARGYKDSSLAPVGAILEQRPDEPERPGEPAPRLESDENQ